MKQAQARQATARQATARRVADLQRLVKARPDNAAVVQQLALAYVVDLDDPGKAAGFLDRTVDEALKAYVPLAAGSGWCFGTNG